MNIRSFLATPLWVIFVLTIFMAIILCYIIDFVEGKDTLESIDKDLKNMADKIKNQDSKPKSRNPWNKPKN